MGASGQKGEARVDQAQGWGGSGTRLGGSEGSQGQPEARESRELVAKNEVRVLCRCNGTSAKTESAR